MEKCGTQRVFGYVMRMNEDACVFWFRRDSEGKELWH